MSYVSVIMAGLLTFVVLLWFTTKKATFKGPRVDLDRLNRMRVEAIHGEVPASLVETPSVREVSVKGE